MLSVRREMGGLGKLVRVSSSTFSRSGTRSRRRFRILGLVAVAGALLLCFLPADVKMALHTRGQLHSVGHFVLFFGVAYVLNRTSRSTPVRVLLFVLTLLLGFGTEFGEHLVYGTNVEWRDIGIDALGAAVGTGLARFSSRRVVSAADQARMRR